MFSAIRSYVGRPALQNYLDNQNTKSAKQVTKYAADFSTASWVEKIHLNLTNYSITFSNQKINYISFYVSNFDRGDLAILELENGQEQKLLLKQKEFTPLLLSCGATRESLVGQRGHTTAQSEWNNLAIYQQHKKSLEALYESLHQLLATELAKILEVIPADKTIQLIVPGCGFAKEAIACYTKAKKTHKSVKVFAFDFSVSNVNHAKKLIAELFPNDQQDFVIVEGDSYQMQQTLNALNFNNPGAVNVMVISGGFNTLVLEPEVNHISVALKAMHAFFEHNIHYILGTGRTLLLLNSNHQRCGFILENHFQIYKLSHAEQFYFHRFRKLTIEEQLCRLRFQDGRIDLSLSANPLLLLSSLSESSRKQIKIIDLSHAYIKEDQTAELARILNKFPHLKMVILDCYTNRWLVNDLQQKDWANRPLIMMQKPELSNLKLAFSMQQLQSYFDINHTSELDDQDLIFPNKTVFKHFELLRLEFAKHYAKDWFKLIIDNNKIVFSIKSSFSSKQLSAIEQEANLFQTQNKNCSVDIKETGEITLEQQVNNDENSFLDQRTFKEKLTLIKQFYFLFLPHIQGENSFELKKELIDLMQYLDYQFNCHYKYKEYCREFNHPIIEQFEQLQSSLLNTYMAEDNYQNAMVYIEKIAALLQAEITLNANELEQMQNKLKQFGVILISSTSQQIEPENNNNCNNAYNGMTFSYI